MEILEKLKEILEKRNIEKYIFDDNPIIAYFATALAGHDLLYKLIQIGSLKQKINVIEHGSSKHIKIMLNDYSPIIRDRAIRKAVALEKSIYHEYVTSEKISILLRNTSLSKKSFFLDESANVFVKAFSATLRQKNDLFNLITDEKFISIVISTIELTDTEIADEMNIDLEESGAAAASIKKEIKKAKKFLSKYNFTFKFEHSYQVGYLIISKDEKNLLNLPVNYSYHNETNPLTFIYILDTVLDIIKEALSVYDVSLDKCDFSSLESFQEYRAKRLFIKKLGFSKEELSEILKENSRRDS